MPRLLLPVKDSVCMVMGFGSETLPEGLKLIRSGTVGLNHMDAVPGAAPKRDTFCFCQLAKPVAHDLGLSCLML